MCVLSGRGWYDQGPPVVLPMGSSDFKDSYETFVVQFITGPFINSITSCNPCNVDPLYVLTFGYILAIPVLVIFLFDPRLPLGLDLDPR